MPIVPRITPAPLPGVRLTPDAPDAAFGGGAGNVTAGINPGLSAVHSEAAGIAQQERVKADQIALTDAGAKASSAMNDTLYGPDGALTKKGKDAFGAPESARQNYFNNIGQVRAGLTNDNQRDAFDRIVANDWSRIDEQVQRHVAQQRVSYDTDSTDALVANKQNEALNGYSDPATVANAIATQRDAISGYAARNGWSDDQTKQAVAKQVSATHYGVVSRMLDNEQDIAATQYFQQHKDEFVGPQLTNAEKLVEAGSARAESQRRADAITGTAVTLRDALQQTSGIDDPRVRDQTEQRVRRHFEDVAADDRQERESAFNQASSILEQTKDASKIPLGLRMKMTPEENISLDHREDQLRHPKTDTNLSVYTHLINLSSLNDATRAEFNTTDLSQYKGQLDDADYKHLLGLQRSARIGEDRTAATSTRRVQQREETGVIKASDAASKQGAGTQMLRDRLKSQGKSDADIDKILPQPKTPRVVVPQWMVDSASHDGEYASYLRAHGVPIAQPPAGTSPAAAASPSATQQPQRPRVPGAPLPSRMPPAGLNLQPQGGQAKKKVSIQRDAQGRAIGMTQE